MMMQMVYVANYINVVHFTVIPQEFPTTAQTVKDMKTFLLVVDLGPEQQELDETYGPLDRERLVYLLHVSDSVFEESTEGISKV